MAPPEGPLVALVGPTATGKSSLALDLAQRINAEIVAADAMALYRHMDIGTAKTPPDQRRGIPHHQLDVLDVTQEASVAAYQAHARADIESIWARGKTALMVGGSGLYVRAALDVIDFPGTDAELRAKWEAYGQANGAEALHAELARLDPAAAGAINPANARRLVRALEVVELTGRPFAANLPQPKAWAATRYLGLDREGAELDRRIELRVDRMMADGLVAETAHLETLGLRQGRTASRAIGYKQCLAHLDGQATIQATAEAIKLATRQLARRQRKWFRRDTRITWLNAGETGALTQALSCAGAFAK